MYTPSFCKVGSLSRRRLYGPSSTYDPLHVPAPIHHSNLGIAHKADSDTEEVYATLASSPSQSAALLAPLPTQSSSYPTICLSSSQLHSTPLSPTAIQPFSSTPKPQSSQQTIVSTCTSKSLTPTHSPLTFASIHKNIESNVHAPGDVSTPRQRGAVLLSLLWDSELQNHDNRFTFTSLSSLDSPVCLKQQLQADPSLSLPCMTSLTLSSCSVPSSPNASLTPFTASVDTIDQVDVTMDPHMDVDNELTCTPPVHIPAPQTPSPNAPAHIIPSPTHKHKGYEADLGNSEHTLPHVCTPSGLVVDEVGQTHVATQVFTSLLPSSTQIYTYTATSTPPPSSAFLPSQHSPIPSTLLDNTNMTHAQSPSHAPPIVVTHTPTSLEFRQQQPGVYEIVDIYAHADISVPMDVEGIESHTHIDITGEHTNRSILEETARASNHPNPSCPSHIPLAQSPVAHIPLENANHAEQSAMKIDSSTRDAHQQTSAAALTSTTLCISIKSLDRFIHTHVDVLIGNLRVHQQHETLTPKADTHMPCIYTIDVPRPPQLVYRNKHSCKARVMLPAHTLSLQSQFPFAEALVAPPCIPYSILRTVGRGTFGHALLIERERSYDRKTNGDSRSDREGSEGGDQDITDRENGDGDLGSMYVLKIDNKKVYVMWETYIFAVVSIVHSSTHMFEYIQNQTVLYTHTSAAFTSIDSCIDSASAHIYGTTLPPHLPVLLSPLLATYCIDYLHQCCMYVHAVRLLGYPGGCRGCDAGGWWVGGGRA